MEDHDEKESRSSLIGARVRGALGVVRQQGAASLRGVRRSAAEAAERLKTTETAERLGAAVEIRRSIKKAADAQRRGNHAMAYRLMEAEVRAEPDDPRVVAAFWSAALACERIDDAVPAMLHMIRTLAVSGNPEHAAEMWLELRAAAPSALADPSSLVRIAAVLQTGASSEHIVPALRDAVDPRNESGLSPGLAVRIADLARARDPATALKAARRALTAPDLDEAKRGRLEELVSGLEKASAEGAANAPAEKPAPPAADTPAEATATPPAAMAEARPAESPPAAPAVTAAAAPAALALIDRAVDDALEVLAPTARFGDIKVTEAMPTRFLEDALGLQLLAGRRVRIDYAKIEAVAVAEVRGLADHPVTVIDLALNWSVQEDMTLWVIRLRSDGFDPRMVTEAPADRTEAFRNFLSELLARSRAVPLPDPDAVLGVNLRPFADVAAYQREVLQIQS
jgi:hypothetical protein